MNGQRPLSRANLSHLDVTGMNSQNRRSPRGRDIPWEQDNE